MTTIIMYTVSPQLLVRVLLAINVVHVCCHCHNNQLIFHTNVLCEINQQGDVCMLLVQSKYS